MKEPAPPHATSRPLAAIGLMVVTFGLFACLDTTAKHLVTAAQLPLILEALREQLQQLRKNLTRA